MNEEEYLGRFAAQLEKAATVAEAYSVAMTRMPRHGTVGRLRHTALLHFLSALLATRSTPPYCVNRNYPVVPAGATLAERNAYRRFVQRLLQAGEIDQADAQYVDHLLKSVQLSPVDFV